MRRVFRYAFLWIAVVFLAAIVVQVFFAGLMLFGQEGGTELHTNTGYILGTAGALFLVVPALARAALHPVNALLIFMLSLMLSRRAVMLVRSERQAT